MRKENKTKTNSPKTPRTTTLPDGPTGPAELDFVLRSRSNCSGLGRTRRSRGVSHGSRGDLDGISPVFQVVRGKFYS